MSRAKTLQVVAGEQDAGKRLDVLLAERNVLLSRSQVQQAIRESRVQMNGSKAKSSLRVSPGDRIEVAVPEPMPLGAEPEDLPLSILFEDRHLVVVDKPAGMVVHPACGNHSGTLVNALLHHCRSLSGIGGILRPGIVHRLDKGTSGVLVVAKNDAAHISLCDQFKCHTVTRQYRALVYGQMDAEEGTIQSLIGRSRTDRKRMSAAPRKGRAAVTHWRVEECFQGFTLLCVKLETGRTHQVRVHLASRGHPIVGDRVYGSGRRIKSASSKPILDALKKCSRPMLHAGCLAFTHPENNEPMAFESGLPGDFSDMLTVLRESQC